MALIHKSREPGGPVVACLLFVLLAFPARGGEIADIDRAEQLGWSDPEAALELIQIIQPSVQSDEELVELLTVRGILRIDKRQDQEAKEIAEQLASMGQRGLVAA